MDGYFDLGIEDQNFAVIVSYYGNAQMVGHDVGVIRYILRSQIAVFTDAK